uniref:Uncharacterized protein n=2 Tax=Latimeria chalumnae TaxID=7897 RepID=M3XLI6_LATCH
MLQMEARLREAMENKYLDLEKCMQSSKYTQLQSEKSLKKEFVKNWNTFRAVNEETVQAIKIYQQTEAAKLLKQYKTLDQNYSKLTQFVKDGKVLLEKVLRAEIIKRDAQGKKLAGKTEGLCEHVRVAIATLQQAIGGVQQTLDNEIKKLLAKVTLMEESSSQEKRVVLDLEARIEATTSMLSLQEHMMSVQLSEVKKNWLDFERKKIETISQTQIALQTQIEELRERVEAEDTKEDLDSRMEADLQAKAQDVTSVRRSRESLHSNVSLMKGENVPRNIAEIQGKLEAFQIQTIKFENSMEDIRTTLNLRLAKETEMRVEEITNLREDLIRLDTEVRSWIQKIRLQELHHTQANRKLFIKEIGAAEATEINRWGIYQAVRWMQWKIILKKLLNKKRERTGNSLKTNIINMDKTDQGSIKENQNKTSP